MAEICNSSFETLSDQDTLGHSLLHMRDELKSLNERELKLARARASALLEGQERERQRIIQELHDRVGQLLTAIRMRMEIFEGESSVKEDIMKQINDTIAEVRRISYNVMPQALVDFGLEAALAGLCDSIKRYSNLKIDFAYVKESDHTLNFEISTALFRIAQEGLNNIVKYAEASSVNLHIIDKEDEVYLVLEDNGKGFDESEVKTKGRNGFAEYSGTGKAFEWECGNTFNSRARNSYRNSHTNLSRMTKIRLLLADDHPLIREGFRSLLNKNDEV